MLTWPLTARPTPAACPPSCPPSRLRCCPPAMGWYPARSPWLPAPPTNMAVVVTCFVNVAAEMPSVMAALLEGARRRRTDGCGNGLPDFVRNPGLVLAATECRFQHRLHDQRGPYHRRHVEHRRSPLNSDNRAINAGYLSGNLVFERINFGLGFHASTTPTPRLPGNTSHARCTPMEGSQHFFLPPSGGRYYSGAMTGPRLLGLDTRLATRVPAS